MLHLSFNVYRICLSRENDARSSLNTTSLTLPVAENKIILPCHRTGIFLHHLLILVFGAGESLVVGKHLTITQHMEQAMGAVCLFAIFKKK